MRSVSILAILSALFLLPAHALAQTPDAEDDKPFDRACMDDYGRDLCDEDIWTEIVTRFGLESAESLQGKGQRGIRVFTIDGYSRDMPAISVLATGFVGDGELTDAVLDVRWESFRGGEKAELVSLKRKAWSDLWEAASDLQDLVAGSPVRWPEDKGPDPETPDEEQVFTLCLHAWVTVTESLADGGVTRRIRNACNSEAVFDASFAMSTEALRGFPWCNHLDPDNYRNASTQLRRCFAIDGLDKSAAADVATLFDTGIDYAADLATHLAPDVRLVLPDRAPVTGGPAVAAALADPAFEEPDLYASQLVGEAGRVSVIGSLEEYVGDDVKASRIDLTWRQHAGAWRIESITIAAPKIFN